MPPFFMTGCPSSVSKYNEVNNSVLNVSVNSSSIRSINFTVDFTIPFFSESYGLPHVLIEIRQDLLLKNKSINFWSNLISNILNKIYNNDKLNYCLTPSNKIRDYYQNKNKL